MNYDYYIYPGAVFRAAHGLPLPREVLDNEGQWAPYDDDDYTDITWYGRKVDEAAAMQYGQGGQAAPPPTEAPPGATSGTTTRTYHCLILSPMTWRWGSSPR